MLYIEDHIIHSTQERFYMNLESKVGSIPKVITYTRVSTADQADLGHSLSVQQNKLKEFAKQNNWKVIEEFIDEGKSARTLDRPSFESMLDYCEENNELLAAVLIQDTSRLCRNAEDHLYVKSFMRKREIRLISLDGNNDDTDEGQFLDLIIAGVNELESKRTGRKTKRVMLAMFEAGFKPGQAPIGFINSFKKGVPMHFDDSCKHFITEIFRLWNTGNYALGVISDTLYKQGFRSVNGNKVGKSSIKDILGRIEYAGGLEYDGKINKNAQHDNIITMEEFDCAQEVSMMRNKGADRSRKHVTLLAGIVHCFKCGRLMHGEYHKSVNYYKCSPCGGPYAKMNYIDEAVSQFFDGASFTEAGLKRLHGVLMEVKADQGSINPNVKKSLEARQKALDQNMNKIEDKLLFNEKNLIDKERVEKKYKKFKEELKQVEKQLADLGKPSNNLTNSEVDRIIWGMGRMKEIYLALDKPDKKRFLKFFIKKIFIDPAENKIKDYELVKEFEMLISKDLVRITSNWLPRLDSNQ